MLEHASNLAENRAILFAHILHEMRNRKSGLPIWFEERRASQALEIYACNCILLGIDIGPLTWDARGSCREFGRYLRHLCEQGVLLPREEDSFEFDPDKWVALTKVEEKLTGEENKALMIAAAPALSALRRRMDLASALKSLGRYPELA